jgi:hypothetical protein
MIMKRILIILAFALLPVLSLRGQELPDTLSVPAAVDSTLLGKDIFTIMGGGVRVNQPRTLKTAFDRYVRDNASKPMSGYRIRVFYDNGQNARTQSEGVAGYLHSAYPGHRVYRSFESPNYKVCIGDFRSKEEALRLFNALKAVYPTAFIIKENINYPR